MGALLLGALVLRLLSEANELKALSRAQDKQRLELENPPPLLLYVANGSAFYVPGRYWW